MILILIGAILVVYWYSQGNTERVQVVDVVEVVPYKSFNRGLAHDRQAIQSMVRLVMQYPLMVNVLTYDNKQKLFNQI